MGVGCSLGAQVAAVEGVIGVGGGVVVRGGFGEHGVVGWWLMGGWAVGGVGCVDGGHGDWG